MTDLTTLADRVETGTVEMRRTITVYSVGEAIRFREQRKCRRAHATKDHPHE